MFDYFIGSNSALWRVIDGRLNDGKIYSSKEPHEHKVFVKIIRGFFVASSLGISAKNLWDESLIEKSNLCTYEEYLDFWRAVSTKDGGRYDASNIYLWMQIVDVVNAICRDLFLSNWEPFDAKHVTIDDGKNHFNGKMGRFHTAVLKPTQLIRDNRRGFVFHT